MSKSRKFDDVLNECLERLLTKGDTIEQCLQGFPEHAGELKPLLETAVATKKAVAVTASPEFRQRARYQLQEALRQTGQERRRVLFGWQPRWVTVTAVVLGFLVAGSATVVGARSSLPGQPLYSVKLATEQAQLLLVPSALGKAELYTKLADKRVSEIVRLVNRNQPEQIGPTTERLNVYLARVADLSSTGALRSSMATAPESGKAQAPVPAPTPAPMPTPTPAPTPAAEAPPSLSDQNELATSTVDRRSRLRAIVARYAVDDSASLRALLGTAPESTRLALQQAIDASESGYEKALRSLD